VGRLLLPTRAPLLGASAAHAPVRVRFTDRGLPVVDFLCRPRGDHTGPC